jgi:hypothetical protein
MESTIALVRIMTQLSSNAPYQIHITSFIAAIKNISKEISFADFSFQVLITWGRNVRDVIAPAE